MKKRLQGLVAGVLIGATVAGGTALAKNISESISVVYRNIGLVVDGEEIVPKDANGNVVEPFIYNGTTYLPVRAIGQAFDKEVSWDGTTSTVYVGGEVEKPATEVFLFDQPYLDCDIPKEFQAGANKNDGTNYIGFVLNTSEKTSDGYEFRNSVTYPVNGLTKKAKGTLLPPDGYSGYYVEYRVKVSNESGKVLYQSPIMVESTAPIPFEFDTGNALQLNIEFIGCSEVNEWVDCKIQDFAIVTTDY